MSELFDEGALVHQLTQHPGWKILSAKWKQRFEERLQKLRTYKRDDAFYKCQGYLDAIEDMFRDVDMTIEDVSENEGE